MASLGIRAANKTAATMQSPCQEPTMLVMGLAAILAGFCHHASISLTARAGLNCRFSARYAQLLA